jgi:hypothetical protein
MFRHGYFDLETVPAPVGIRTCKQIRKGVKDFSATNTRAETVEQKPSFSGK